LIDRIYWLLIRRSIQWLLGASGLRFFPCCKGYGNIAWTQ